MIDIPANQHPVAHVQEYDTTKIIRQNHNSVNTLPAEFSEQKMLWLAWKWDCAKKTLPYYTTLIEIIKAASSEINVGILYNEEDDLSKIKFCLQKEVELSERIFFFPLKISSIWLRDTGPTFIKDKNSQVKLVQFQFSEWGYQPSSGKITAAKKSDHLLSENFSKAFNIPLFKTPIFSEGGNKEANGKGVLLVGENLELARNPGMSKKDLEAQYAFFLGTKKTIWLPSGLKEDDPATKTLLFDLKRNLSLYTPFTPGGHLDEFCRFINDHTILLADAPSVEDPVYPHIQENFKRLQKCYDILIKEVDQNGNPFNIIRIPTAKPMTETFYPGDPFFDYYRNCKFKPNSTFPEGRFPIQEQYDIIVSASYLNFVKINNLVLIPAYWKEGLAEEIKATDEEAYACFKKIFPDLKIIQINPYNVNIGGGGLHCVTLNEPL